MEKAKCKSIKMTDSEFEAVKQEAANRKLPLGKFIYAACREYGSRSDEIGPEVFCRLQNAGNMLKIPVSCWNDRMLEIYNKNLEVLCSLSKW